MLQSLLDAKNELKKAETLLEDQLSNPKNGSYGSSPEQKTLECFYYLASAKAEYNEVLEEFYEDFEYF